MANGTETPRFRDWKDFLARTSEAERMRWCAQKASSANQPRLMSGSPEQRVSKEDVWAVLERAQGRCCHCGSLAVEHKPSNRKGVPWNHVGRRIGSLEHVVPRCGSRWEGFNGANHVTNLAWACHWCNTWNDERIRGALDHGGYYPAEEGVRPPAKAQAPVRRRGASVAKGTRGEVPKARRHRTQERHGGKKPSR